MSRSARVRQWVNVSDRHYQHVPLTPSTAFRFAVHVVPTPLASWADGLAVDTPLMGCTGRPVPVGIVMSGEPPFTLRYQLQRTVRADDHTPDGPGEMRSVTFAATTEAPAGSLLKSIVGTLQRLGSNDGAATAGEAAAGAGGAGGARVRGERQLELPPLAQPGTYVLRLQSIKDLHGCETSYVWPWACRRDVGMAREKCVVGARRFESAATHGVFSEKAPASRIGARPGSMRGRRCPWWLAGLPH